MARYTLTINGAERTVNVAADAPLVYVLRNEWRLTGKRLGCGMARCRAGVVRAGGKGCARVP